MVLEKVEPRICARPDCDMWIPVTDHLGTKFCGDRCREANAKEYKANWQRNRYHSDPEYREQRIENERAYKQRKAAERPPKICAREGCDEALENRRKKYCSECRIIVRREYQRNYREERDANPKRRESYLYMERARHKRRYADPEYREQQLKKSAENYLKSEGGDETDEGG